jgi:hypothetical protein
VSINKRRAISVLFPISKIFSLTKVVVVTLSKTALINKKKKYYLIIKSAKIHLLNKKKENKPSYPTISNRLHLQSLPTLKIVVRN